MDLDALRLVASKLPVADVANIALATRDQDLIRTRKKLEYDSAFDKKMRSLWYGRLALLYKMYTTTSFWSFDFPNMWACHARMRDHCRYLFREWKVDTCGNKLHMTTRILDQILSVTVDLHAPYHSIGIGDPIEFKFDIVHADFPLDLDAYAPDGPFTCVLNAMYRALVRKTEQKGTMTNVGVVWTKYVTNDDMLAELEKALGLTWSRQKDDVFYKYHRGIHARARLTERIGDINFSEVQNTDDGRTTHTSIIHIGYYSYLNYRGADPSTRERPGGTLRKKLLDAMIPFNTYAPLHPVLMSQHYSIKIRIDDEEHEFCSWSELSEISNISVPKLRSMAISSANGVFIDFGKHTYKRKPIKFVVPKIS